MLRLDPGLNVGPAEAVPRVPPVQPTILALGRTADIALKGLDLAAGAVAAHPVRTGRPAPVLVVRGAPAALCEQVRNALVGTSGLARGRVDVRPYVADPTAVRRDLLRSALRVMPSRSEGFGLVACEAVAVGTPVLVSAQSGAAELLWEHLGPTAES